MEEKETKLEDQTPEKQPSEQASSLDADRSVPENLGGGRKSSWPEVVGLSAEDAERKIKEDMPEARIHILPSGSFVTMDYRTDRIRIFIDDSGKVAIPPRIG